jgi:hypothetical protein
MPVNCYRGFKARYQCTSEVRDTWAPSGPTPLVSAGSRTASLTRLLLVDQQVQSPHARFARDKVLCRQRFLRVSLCRIGSESIDGFHLGLGLGFGSTLS